MSQKRRFYLRFGLICILSLQTLAYSQIQEAEPKPSPNPVNQAQNQNSAKEKDRLVHFGDIIDVDIVGSTEYDWRGRINPEGFLDGLEFIDEPVYALCRNEESVAADIVKGYSKLLRDPKVIVTIVDKTGRPNSYLYGAVKTPHRFSLQREARLSELIILAGGLTDQASGEIQIIRPSNLSCESDENPEKTAIDQNQSSQKVADVKNANPQGKTLNIKISDLLKGAKDSNPLIENGDIITVLQSEPIYIIGGVLNPRQINIGAKMTVSRAVASAGGLSKNADPKNVTIFRRSAGETKVIQLNLDFIIDGKAEDIALQKYDIVEVGQSGAERRKIPPVVKTIDNEEKRTIELPLRVIR